MRGAPPRITSTKETANEQVRAFVTSRDRRLHVQRIAGFGTFATRARGARQGRNPRTGEPLTIAATKAPAFKVGKTLRDALRQ